MNESQAWKHLADLWNRPPDMNVFPYQTVEGIMCLGLCLSIRSLYRADKISERVADKMLSRLEAMGKIDHSYFWPLTKEGAKQRTEFCKTQSRSRRSWFSSWW